MMKFFLHTAHSDLQTFYGGDMSALPFQGILPRQWCGTHHLAGCLYCLDGNGLFSWVYNYLYYANFPSFYFFTWTYLRQ